MKVFDYHEAEEAKRKLTGMLPSGLEVHTALLNYNCTLAVTIANGTGAVRYEFGWAGRDSANDGHPGLEFNRTSLLEIADQWATGTFVAKAYETPVRAVPPTPYIYTPDALVDWVAKARKGDTVVYFRGSVAQFRSVEQRRLVDLQRLADQAHVNKPRSAAERREMERLQRTQAILAQIDLFMRKDLITLSQRPDLEGNGTAYLAIRKGKNMAVSHPYTEGKLKKEITNAINIAWGRYSADFQIAAIDFEGQTDPTHITTAKVLVYRDNPQEPTVIFIPATDLGDNRNKWPHILAAKAKKVVNQVNAREGRLRTKITSLSDKRI